MTTLPETIFALATPPGRSGVAVLRVSGPHALSGLQHLTQSDLPTPRTATLRTLRHPVSRETIDRALILTFPAPASYTGEDLVEYHLHGSRAIVSELYDILSKLDSYRLAQPGEFTRRAFENGKMDLTEAEAIADLIDAETQTQRLQALRQMDGALTTLYESWRTRLLKTLAHLEADLDFPDEDLPQGLPDRLGPDIAALENEMAAHLNDSRRGERLRDGIRVVILGPPNAGKSTLLNALSKREAAIVSDLPGTTRDRIEIALDIGGYPVLLSDTAGLRTPSEAHNAKGHEAIEKQGIDRALEAAQNADLRILMFDGQRLDSPDPQTLAWTGRHAQDIVVLNKIDDPMVAASSLEPLKPYLPLPLSAKTGQGLETLLAKLTEKLTDLYQPRETPNLTRARHRQALERARTALVRSRTAPLPELAAEDIRLATRALGEITGRVDVEDLLDVIFRDFCIGK